MPWRYELPIWYLACLWLEVARMSPTADVFAATRELLGRNDLSPAIAAEGTLQRPALVNTTGLQVVLPGESFDIALLPIVAPDGSDAPMMPFAQFAALAGVILGAFARHHASRPGRRITLWPEGFLNFTSACLHQTHPPLF